jgi:Na+/melibiose symporter-like transporter
VNSIPPPKNGALSWIKLAGFGQLAVPLAFAQLPMTLFVAKFYAQDLMMGVAAVGYALLAARLVDIIIDPVIGVLGDRTTMSFGRRRLWVLLGAPVFAFGIYLVFMPPVWLSDASEMGRWSYFLAAIAVFYLGWTMITIPYGAWGAELSGDYNERSRITGVREIFTLLGAAIAGVTPLFIGAPAEVCDAAGNLMVTGGGQGGLFETIRIMGVIILAMLPVSLVVLYATTPEPPHVHSEHFSFWKGLKLAAANPAFFKLFSASFCIRMGARAVEVLLIFYLISAVLFTDAQSKTAVLALIGPAILFAPFWIWAGGAWTKHKALAIAMGLAIAAFLSLPFIRDAGYIVNLLAFAVLGAAYSAPFTLGQSMAADVVDLDTLQSHQPRAGLFFAMFQISVKAADALGAGLAFMMVGWLGFQAERCVVNSAEAIDGLAAVYVAFPILLWIPAIFLLWNYPITPAEQLRIRTELMRREAEWNKTHPQG